MPRLVRLNAIVHRLAWLTLVATAMTGCSSDSSDEEPPLRKLEQPLAPDTQCTAAEFEGHQYWFCNDPRSFEDARSNCQAQGLDLASVETQAENDFLRGHTAVESYLGLTDAKNEGAFRWAGSGKLSFCGGNDGKTTTPDGYVNFATYHPVTSSCDYETRGGRAYWFCDTRLPWDEASRACHSVGMTLARVDDAAENSYLASKLMPSVWLGGSDSKEQGTWRWQNEDAPFWIGGRAGAAVDGFFTNFAQNTPVDSDAYDCLALHNNPAASWHSEPCAGFNAWVCEGEIPEEPELPEAHDCVTLHHADGTWSNVDCARHAGYVCETPPLDAGKSLEDLTTGIRDDYRSGRPRVGHATFTSESQITDPFLTHGDRLGLRACVDGLEPKPLPRAPAEPGNEVIDYRQTYQGVPVMTRGYVVHRDPTTKKVKSFTGRIEHNISVDTNPTVQELDAFLKACEHAGVNWALYGANRPQGELVIWPAHEGKEPVWELGWHYALPPQGAAPRNFVTVSAKTGAILGFATSVASCTSATAPETTLTPADLSITAYQQTDFGDPSRLRGSLLPNSAPEPYMLLTDGLLWAEKPDIPLNRKPRMYMQCPEETFPKVVALPSDTIAFSEGNDAHIAAGIFTGAQRTIEFFAGALTTQDGLPWQGIDGDGVESIDLRLYDDLNDQNAYFDHDGRFARFEVNYMAKFGAGIEVPAHELSHGLWGTFVDPAWRDSLETASVAEGFSDALAEAAELWTRKYSDQRAFCMTGDQQTPAACDRNLKDPNQSKGGEDEQRIGYCKTYAASGEMIHSQCPAEYGGPDFCALPRCQKRQSRDCCDEHTNATVLGHWFYLIATGDVGVNKVSCAYDVPPLAPTLEEAVPKASKILFNAIRDKKFADRSGFDGFANATIEAAKELYGPTSNEVRSVVAAWYAVNVKENYFEGSPSVQPVRNEGLVYPWTTFKWPLVNDETAWDFQIVTGSFDAPTSIYEKSTTETVTEGTLEFGTIKLALPTDDERRFYWRVRPHSTDETWSDCYPIHSFIQTRAPEEVEWLNVRYHAVEGEDDLYRAGDIGLSWSKVRGATEYKVFASKAGTNTECTGGDGAIEATVEEKLTYDEFGDLRDYAFLDYLPGLDPEETYVIQVKPIGPEGFDGELAEGACFKKTIRTAPMRAPAARAPRDTFVFYGENPTFEWHGYDAPHHYEFQLYEMDEHGECSSSPHEETFVDPCPWEYCGYREAQFASAHTNNPTGYCWSVTSVAKNDKRSPPSELVKFTYWQDVLEKIGPGINAQPVLTPDPGLVGILPKDSYGEPVKFSWKPPLVAPFDYVVKGGKTRWAYDAALPSDPAQCAFYSCRQAPDEVTFREENILTTSTTLTAEQAGRGRYCWTVWPRFTYNGSLTRQPDNVIYPTYCYTTGPATPEWHVDNPPDPAKEFSSDPVTGFIDLAYVPDSQVRIEGNSPDIQVDPLCESVTRAGRYKDLYECRVNFNIQPEPEQQYRISVRTWHSDRFPPVLDDDSLVHDITIPVDTGICGGEGESCCPSSKCDVDSLTCDPATNRCVPCGGPDEACCRGRTSDCDNPSDQICLDDKCQDCGRASLNQPCCEGQQCSKESFATCQSNQCVECGHTGGSCCPGNSCRSSNDFCNSGGTCQTIETVACNSTIYSTPNGLPERFRVNFGSSPGTVVLTAHTASSPDQIRLTANGSSLDTSCVATNKRNIPGWTCILGECSKRWFTLPASQSSKVLDVDLSVQENCAGGQESQQIPAFYYFRVSCPTNCGAVICPN